MSGCFEDHIVEEIERRSNLSWRQLIQFMLKDKKGNEERSAELDTCMHLATREEAQLHTKSNKDRRTFFPWLYHVSTDRNCSRDTVMEVQNTVLHCLDRETYRNLHQLASIKLSN